MSYRISLLRVRNFKRIKLVELAPGAETRLYLIGGKNRQGKTSILDALQLALGGKSEMPPDPIRHGATAAEIDVEIVGDAGERLRVKRRITPRGDEFEVKDAKGVIKKPQAVLDQLIGSRFIDPLQFLQKDAKEQRAKLLELIPEAAKIVELDQQHAAIFSERRDINRDLKKAEAELDRIEVPALATEELVSVGDLAAELAQERSAAERVAAQERAEAAVERDRHRAEEEVERLERALEEAKERAAKAIDLHNKTNAHTGKMRAEAAGALERAKELGAKLAGADDRNAKIQAARALAARQKQARDEVSKLTVRSEKLTATLAEIEEEKKTTLAAAKLPVAGLGFDDNGVTFGGVPLSQASGAERFQVALGISVAARPELRDVWIRDGALLDDESLAAVAAMAEKRDIRAWIERVGEEDEGAIIIRDGEVANA